MKPKFLDHIEEAFAENRNGVLHFNTTDRFYWPEEGIGPSSLQFFLAKWYAGKGYNLAEYAPASGLVELKSQGKNKDNKDPFKCLAGQHEPAAILNKIISTMRRKEEKWIFFIHHGEHIAPRESIGVSAASMPGQVHALELLHRISFDDAITSGQSRALIITYSELPADLITRANGYETIRIDLPTFEERLPFIEFMEQMSKEKSDKFGKLGSDLDKKELAKLTAGMPLIGIESLYLTAAYKKKPISKEQVRARKAKILTQLAQDLLEVTEPQISFFDVAGMKHVVEVFQRLINQFRAGSNGVTQTLLLQGPPGSGKTHVCQALAHELGVPLVQLRAVRGPYVGQSEQQLELVIGIIEQLKPVVLLLDEIDQLIGQRGTGASGDSGTSERMMARFFTWLGSMEHRGKLIVIGTSNRPDLLDAALLDRFRVSIPVLNPTKNDLAELIPLILDRFGRQLENGVNFQEAAGILSPLRPSGRSVQEILIQAGLFADHEKAKIGATIETSHLVKAAHDYLPIEDPVELEFITLNSLAMCSANSFLPWMSIDGLRPDAEIPEELITDEIADEKTGRLNKSKLHQKLGELNQARQMIRAMR